MVIAIGDFVLVAIEFDNFGHLRNDTNAFVSFLLHEFITEAHEGRFVDTRCERRSLHFHVLAFYGPFSCVP